MRTGLCPHHVDIPHAIDWLVSFQDPSSGCIITPHYTAYFLLICQSLDKVGPQSPNNSRLTEACARSVRYLTDVLGKSGGGLWTGEGWSNGQILWALAEGNWFPIHDGELLTKTLSWFEESAQKQIWGDVEDAASAILGLHSLLKRLVAALDDYDPRRPVHIQEQLQKRISVPRLYVSHRMWQKEEDGSFSLNISHRAIELTKRTGAIIAAVGVIATLIDFSLNHWNWIHWLQTLWKR